MGMVPSRSIKTGNKLVSVTLPGRDGTLSDAWGAIFPWCLFLQETVPMKGGALLRTCNVVVHVHDNCVTPVRLNQRPWKGAIDKENCPLVAIRRNDSTAYCEVIIPHDAGPRELFVRIVGEICECSPWIPVWKRIVGKKKSEAWK